VTGAQGQPRVRWSPSGPWAELGEPWAGFAETHTAVVWFAGDRAYKVKKPVAMPFLDFTDRAARRADCEAEVALNRRLSPDVYLGVAELRGPDENEGEPVVVMRRMPRRRRLSTLVTQGADVTDALRDAARRVAALHAGSAPRRDVDLAADTARLWSEGFAQLRELRSPVLEPPLLAECERLASGYVGGRGALFAERVRAGRVRDGHGDLLADDVFCLDDGVRILDCLEFDLRLRLGDVLADAAFLGMDLERLGRPDLARCFLDDYARYSAETHPASLEHHYVAYRAFVRTKVECLRAAQGDESAADRASALLALTARRLRAGAVRLVLLGGLPATGKSTLAASLARRGAAAGRPWVVLRSDVVRKELARLPSSVRADADYGAGAYDAAVTDATYAELLRRAAVALARGESVVLDASFSREQHRAAARGLGRWLSCEVSEVQAVCPRAVSAERIARRREVGTDASDATVEVLDGMSAAFEAWPQAGQVDTAGSTEQSDAAVDGALSTAAEGTEAPVRSPG
jgi:uncharacterized protein